MVGDVLIVRPVHDTIAREIFKILKNDGDLKKIVVSIAGESGTGKSEIAHELRILLKREGFKVKIFHLDNYYDTDPEKRNEIRIKRGIESVGDEEIQWHSLEGDINAFRRGKKARIPFIDLYTNQKDILTTHFEHIDILIIEGLYATRAMADFRFFIDLTYHQTKLQREQRKKEVQNEFRFQVLEQEHKSVQSHRKLAHYLIKLNGLGEDGKCQIVSTGLPLDPKPEGKA